MAPENLEVVRQAIDANRSDDLEANIEKVLSLSGPEIEFRSAVSEIDGESYRGHDGVRRYINQLAESWERWQNEVEELVEMDADTVLADVRFRAVGKNSGVPIERLNAIVFVLSAGKLTGVYSYPTREQALAAARVQD